MPELNPDRLNSLFRNSSSAIFLTNAARNITEVNDAFCNTFRVARQDVIGRTAAVLFADPGDYDNAHAAVTRNGQVGRALIYATYMCSDGVTFPGQTSVMRLTDHAGEDIGLAGIINDLSDLHAEDEPDILAGVELRAAERAKLRALYRRTPAMMYSIGPDGVVLDVSDAWLDRFGYLRDEVIGQRSVAFLNEASRAYAQEVVLPAFWEKRMCRRVPYTFLTKAGEPVEAELSAVVDDLPDGPRTFAIVEDVSERNRAQRALEQRNQDLRDFAHVAAHDLQSPLRHISVFADMVAEDIEEGALDEARRNLAIVSDSASRLSKLIRSLLDFSLVGHEALRLEDGPLGATMQSALIQLQDSVREADASVEIGSLPDLICDHALVEQVFVNLLSNSLKYVAQDVRPRIEVRSEVTPSDVFVRVSDNGIGIPEAFHERVFQPLRRVHAETSRYSGNGIGLALCKRLVEAHDGAIAVERSDSAGTVFAVRFPRHV